MTGIDGDGDLRVDVWMREHRPLPDDPRTTVLSRLRELESAGEIDDVAVHVWGKRVALSNDGTDDGGESVQPPVDEFLEWAERNGHSLDPAFRRCERSTLVSEEKQEILVLPMQCLAVYEDDDLAAVFPCSTDDGVETVTDCLERLETGEFGEQ